MSRQHHHLKTQTEHFQAVERGKKKFEIRKNDRNYQPFDMVYLHEYCGEAPTGRELPGLEIQYIFHGGKYGLDSEYCVFCW